MDAQKFNDLANEGSYDKYNTQYPGQKERINQPLWDTLVYTSNATTQLTFFNGVRATLDLSNMQQAGVLAAPQGFLIRALRFFVKVNPYVVARAAAGSLCTGLWDDVQQLLNTAVLQLTIGSKTYAQVPLWMVPAGGGVFGSMGCDGNTADPGTAVSYAQCGSPVVDNCFSLARPLFIAPQINFKIDIIWGAAVTLACGNPPLTVVMDGDIVRPKQ